MDTKKSGGLISTLRREKKLTQKEVAEKLHVSEQAVSKWERGAGAPDVSLINSLALILGVSAREILSGEMASNEEDTGNMKRTKLYICRECGNLITSTGKVELTCCGKVLKELEPQKTMDEQHMPSLETIDGEVYLKWEHEMSKDNYISFAAYLTCDKLLIIKLYPEQNAEVRFQKRGHGLLYWYCTEHGLFSKII